MVQEVCNINNNIGRVLFIIKNSALNRKMNTGLENLAWGLAERGFSVYIVSGGNKPENRDYHLPSNVKYFFANNDGENPMNLVSKSIEVINTYEIKIVIGWIKNLAMIARRQDSSDIRYIANQGELSPKSIAFSILKSVIKRRLVLFDAINLLKDIKKFPVYVSKVVSISYAVQQTTIRSYGISSQKCVVINRGIDIHFYKMNIDNFSEKKEKIRLLYAGNIQKAKGIDDLIQALKYVDTPVNLILCGKVENSYLEKIKYKLNSHKKNHEIEYLGKLRQDELVLEYNRCDIFVFPSHAEGLGKVLIEAMSCSCPVICSDIDTFKEIINDDFNGLMFKVKSATSLSNAINKFVSDQKLRSRCGENARKTVEEKFSKEAELNSWITVIQNEMKEFQQESR
jgi:glycosyltransferase involved in cell wall biosynthesis